MTGARAGAAAEAIEREVRPGALGEHLARQLGVDAEAIEVEPLTDGHSNLTYRLATPKGSYVLRRPPLGPLPPSAHDVLREHRVLSLLDGRGARTPRPILTCEDESVIGAPFYLMEHVDGFVLEDELPAEVEGPADAGRIAAELVDALVELHGVEWRGTELASLARPDGYIERQLRLWRRQWRHNKTRETDRVEAIGEWLERRQPARSEVTVVHGDYKLNNLIFGRVDGQLRAKAIVDWEMSTLGDPLADLGYLTAIWTEPGEDPALLLGLSPVTANPGFGSREALAERYAERSGRDPGDLLWYQVLAIWKLAILLEGSYKRHLAGTTSDPWFAELGEGVPMLLDRAALLCSEEGR